MGTDFTLYIYAADAEAADREAERVFAIVDQLDSLLSNYQLAERAFADQS